MSIEKRITLQTYGLQDRKEQKTWGPEHMNETTYRAHTLYRSNMLLTKDTRSKTGATGPGTNINEYEQHNPKPGSEQVHTSNTVTQTTHRTGIQLNFYFMAAAYWIKARTHKKTENKHERLRSWKKTVNNTNTHGLYQKYIAETGQKTKCLKEKNAT